MEFKEVMRSLFMRRTQAYRNMFRNHHGDEAFNLDADVVLSDLRRFCYGTGGNFHPDALEHARREGRREVWERIMSYLNASDEEIYNLVESIGEENE